MILFKIVVTRPASTYVWRASCKELRNVKSDFLNDLVLKNTCRSNYLCFRDYWDSCHELSHAGYSLPLKWWLKFPSVREKLYSIWQCAKRSKAKVSLFAALVGILIALIYNRMSKLTHFHLLCKSRNLILKWQTKTITLPLGIVLIVCFQVAVNRNKCEQCTQRRGREEVSYFSDCVCLPFPFKRLIILARITSSFHCRLENRDRILHLNGTPLKNNLSITIKRGEGMFKG